jgi:hypothetical protein
LLVGFVLVLVGVGAHVWLLNLTFNADIAQLRERFPADRDASVQPNLPAMVKDYAARAGGLPGGRPPFISGIALNSLSSRASLPSTSTQISGSRPTPRRWCGAGKGEWPACQSRW